MQKGDGVESEKKARFRDYRVKTGAEGLKSKNVGGKTSSYQKKKGGEGRSPIPCTKKKQRKEKKNLKTS